MRIAILGLGVIGTTYAYAFQKAGHQVEHVLRDSKRNNAPNSLSVDLLDGRYHSKGTNTTPMKFMWQKLVRNTILFF